MAPSRIQFGVADSAIPLSRKVVKSYLPQLWRLLAQSPGWGGFVDLERLVRARTDAAYIALQILLNALRASEQGLGPSSELKEKLTRAIRLHTGHKRSPEPLSSKIFTMLASYLERLSRHQELTYAMSEWFAIHAAGNVLSPATLFAYVVALDHLGADMTAPLNAFMRTGSLSSDALHNLALQRKLRPGTIKQWKRLCRDQINELRSARHSPPRLLAGGKVDVEELLEQYRRDPDSIIIDLSSPKQLGGAHDFYGHRGHLHPRRRRSLDDCSCNDYASHDVHCAAYGYPSWMLDPPLLDERRLIRPSMHRFHSLPHHPQRFITDT
ncbi:MAG: hypothetical protein Q9183_003337 [Haloplaca sp. 2 TL-2023]